MYGHIASSKSTMCSCIIFSHLTLLFLVAEAVKSGIEKSGGQATVYQYAFTPICIFLSHGLLS